MTKIINSDYRNTYSFSSEMSGAINQVLHYRQTLMENYYSIHDKNDDSFFAFNPKCVVVIGKLSNYNEKQRAAIETYRNTLNNTEVITYDEILERLKGLKDIFSTCGFENE